VRKLSLLLVIVAAGLAACEDNCREHRSVHNLLWEAGDYWDTVGRFFFRYSDSTMFHDGNPDVSAYRILSNSQYIPDAQFSPRVHAANSSTNLKGGVPCGEAHQVFYRISDSLDMTIEYVDSDENGNPVGQLTKVTTGQPSTGTLTITLIHNPDKFAQGVKDGDITHAGGLVDFECTFDVEIQ
jgi:hypothetical protein